MKHLEQLADMRDWTEKRVEAIMHYEEYGHLKDDWRAFEMECYKLTLEDKPTVVADLEVVKYLLNCRRGYVINTRIAEKAGVLGQNKPTVEQVNKTFDSYLEHITDNWEKVNRTVLCDRNIELWHKKRFACVRHYKFQFSLPAWYKKMPVRIPTSDEKWGKVTNEG